MPKKNPHTGPTLEEFLAEEGMLHEINAQATKEVLALHVHKIMEEQGLTKVEMARRMKTSRPSVDRLLDPANNSVTLHTIHSAAEALGMLVRITLTPAPAVRAAKPLVFPGANQGQKNSTMKANRAVALSPRRAATR